MGLAPCIGANFSLSLQGCRADMLSRRRRSLTSTIIDPRTTDLIDEPQLSVPALYHAIRVTLEVETPAVRSSSSSIDDLGIREIEREVHQIVEDARQQWSAADRRLRMDNDGCQVELHDWLWFGGDYGTSGTDEQLWVPYTAHYCHRLDYLRANEPNNGRLETDDGAHYVELRAGGRAVQVDMDDTRNFTSVKCVRAPTMTVTQAVAWHAVLTGNCENLEKALRAGVSPNYRGPSYSRGTLLHAACERRSIGCARLLLDGTAHSDSQVQNERANPGIRDAFNKAALSAEAVQRLPVRDLLEGLIAEKDLQDFMQVDSKEALARALASREPADLRDSLNTLVGWKVLLKGRHAVPGQRRTPAIVFSTAQRRVGGVGGFGGRDTTVNEVRVFIAAPPRPDVPDTSTPASPTRGSRPPGVYSETKDVSFDQLETTEFELCRRVSDDEMRNAVRDDHTVDANLQEIPPVDVRRRSSYNYELAARLELEACVSQCLALRSPDIWSSSDERLARESMRSSLEDLADPSLAAVRRGRRPR